MRAARASGRVTGRSLPYPHNLANTTMRRSATLAVIVSPIGLIVISVIRLLIVAGYNPDTALAIVSSGGYVGTLLGTIIPLVPIFAPYLALVLLFFNRVIPAILMLLATAFMSPVVTGRCSKSSSRNGG